MIELTEVKIKELADAIIKCVEDNIDRDGWLDNRHKVRAEIRARLRWIWKDCWPYSRRKKLESVG